MRKVRKAVFPVAGLGTRFLPATKASPKEMLPVVDKPLIQYAVEEAAAAGITEMIFVTGRNKRNIEDHFDRVHELEAALQASTKTELLDQVQNLLPANISYAYTRQPEPLGLGHAVLCAKSLVGNEPFAVLLADDLIDAATPVLKQMAEVFDRCSRSMVGVQTVPRRQTDQYGIVSADPVGIRLHQVTGLVEKPKPAEAPSTLGAVGRYIFTPAIFSNLERLDPGAGGEIQLTDGIQALLQEEPVLAYQFLGDRYDCGSKFGYLQAVITFGLKHPELGHQLSRYLQSLSEQGRRPRPRPKPAFDARPASLV